MPESHQTYVMSTMPTKRIEEFKPIIPIMKKTICFDYYIDNETKDLDSYQKYIRGNSGYELRNIVMDIIHFSKTGELLKDEETGGIKHYSFLTEG